MSPRESEKKELIQYRIERSRSTLRDAQILYEQGGNPASIVNRAYYAMFYAALALLVTIGQETSKHQGVLALFDQYFIKTKALPKEMSKFLHHAFDSRQAGDYEDEVILTQEQALQILESAVQFINSIEEKLLDKQT
ncbi:MAG: HEPN domain-containing protein [Anaerolineae bacterium]|nr:HEPN domain-containing protein [Anaerolineae bacterium]